MDQQFQRKKQAWADHVQAQSQSGLSQKAYCRQHSLKPSQFWYWKKKLTPGPAKAEPEQRKEPTQTSFIPVSVGTTVAADGLTLHFPSGFQLTGITEQNAQTVHLLIGSLR